MSSELESSASLAIKTFFIDSPPPPLSSPPPSPFAFMAMKYLQSLTLKEVTERWDKEEDRGAYKGKQFVAEVNGEVVGWCEVRLAKFGIGFEQLSQYAVDRNASLAEVPLMTNLCVDKDFRGQGVGKALVDAALKAGSSWGKDVYLQVEATNRSAIKFYQKLNFEVVFDDPSCRRVDVGWLGWEEKRTTKTCMRKRVRWF